MSKYFDKDFFKFTLGFLAIVAFSLVLIIVAKYYDDVKSQSANVIESFFNIDRSSQK